MGDFMPPGSANTKLFGHELRGQYLPFIVCSGGIFTCYCLSSISQEYLYQASTMDGEGNTFHYTSSLTLWCKLAAVLWGIGGGGLSERRAPHSWHALVGVLTFATMWLSNQSLLWLNYPTQTLFKSAKLLPVMAGAILINGTRFHLFEYLSALSLLGGLVAFTLTDMRVLPKFDIVGVGVICLALVADALIGNIQERMFHLFKTSASEMMTYSSAYAALLSLFMCILGGETVAGVKFLLSNPLAAGCVACYAFLNILGIYFVLVMIAHYGATLTTFTTSLRKALSVILSFVFYPKPLAWGYLFGSLATAVGIALNMRASQLKKLAKESKTVRPDGKAPQVELHPLVVHSHSRQNLSMSGMMSDEESGNVSGGSGRGSAHMSPALPTTPFEAGHGGAHGGMTSARSSGGGGGGVLNPFAFARASPPQLSPSSLAAAADLGLDTSVRSPSSTRGTNAAAAALQHLRVDAVLQALNTHSSTEASPRTTQASPQHSSGTASTSNSPHTISNTIMQARGGNGNGASLP